MRFKFLPGSVHQDSPPGRINWALRRKVAFWIGAVSVLVVYVGPLLILNPQLFLVAYAWLLMLGSGMGIALLAFIVLPRDLQPLPAGTSQGWNWRRFLSEGPATLSWPAELAVGAGLVALTVARARDNPLVVPAHLMLAGLNVRWAILDLRRERPKP
jgi:hypothetical protein